MKNCSPELLAHIQQARFALTAIVRVTRTDDVVTGFTNYNRTLNVDGLDYIPGYTRTAITASDGLNVDRLDLEGWLGEDIFDPKDLRAGLYDDARVRVAIVNPKDLTMGMMILPGGVIGQIEMESPIKFKIEVASIANRYQQTTGKLYSQTCRAQWGDQECKFERVTFAGSVDTILTARRKFIATATGDPFPANDLLPVPEWKAKHDYYAGQSVLPSTPTGFRYKAQTSGKSAGTEPTWPIVLGDVVADKEVSWIAVKDDYFKYGRFVWDTGLNTGRPFEVKQYNGADTFELFLKTNFPITAGDTFTVEPGDDKEPMTCLYKFNNMVNFRGEGPWVRGERKLLEAPDATKIKGS